MQIVPCHNQQWFMTDLGWVTAILGILRVRITEQRLTKSCLLYTWNFKMIVFCVISHCKVLCCIYLSMVLIFFNSVCIISVVWWSWISHLRTIVWWKLYSHLYSCVLCVRWRLTTWWEVFFACRCCYRKA